MKQSVQASSARKHDESQIGGENKKGKRQRRFEKQLISALKECRAEDDRRLEREDDDFIKQVVSAVAESRKYPPSSKPSAEQSVKLKGPGKLQAILGRVRSKQE